MFSRQRPKIRIWGVYIWRKKWLFTDLGRLLSNIYGILNISLIDPCFTFFLIISTNRDLFVDVIDMWIKSWFFFLFNDMYTLVKHPNTQKRAYPISAFLFQVFFSIRLGVDFGTRNCLAQIWWGASSSSSYFGQ